MMSDFNQGFVTATILLMFILVAEMACIAWSRRRK